MGDSPRIGIGTVREEDLNRPHSGTRRTGDVGVDLVADVHRLGRLDAEFVGDRLERTPVGFAGLEFPVTSAASNTRSQPSVASLSCWARTGPLVSSPTR